MNNNTLIIIMGVSGSGKSTVGKYLAEKLSLEFYDGDDFHPQANIEKMEAGIPLTDEDREPWLQKINLFAREKVNQQSLVIACSALKESYRATLAYEINTIFIYLKGDAQLITERLRKRKGHFMPTDLLDSQFAILEEPSDAITVSIDQDVNKIIEQLLSELKSHLDVTKQ